MAEYINIRPIKFVVIDPNSDVIDAGDEIYTRASDGKTWLSSTGGRFVMLTDTTDPNCHLYSFKALPQVTNPHVPTQKPLSHQEKTDLATATIGDSVEILDSAVVDFLQQLDDSLTWHHRDLQNQRSALRTALFNVAETPTP